MLDFLVAELLPVEFLPSELLTAEVLLAVPGPLLALLAVLLPEAFVELVALECFAEWCAVLGCELFCPLPCATAGSVKPPAAKAASVSRAVIRLQSSLRIAGLSALLIFLPLVQRRASKRS